MKLTFLFLYSEIMPYNLACFRSMHQSHRVFFHVINWDRKKLTPYQTQNEAGIQFYNRTDFTVYKMKNMVDRLQPNLIYVAGRMDPEYLKVTRYARKKGIVTVSSWDNQWLGTFRQRLACLFSWWLYKRYFDFIMIPGLWQYEYVRRLGYAKDQIVFGSLSCDVALFDSAFQDRKKMGFPNGKKILFIGRFTEVKGIMLLSRVFQEIRKEGFAEWRLIMIGNGPLEIELQREESIDVIPFLGQVEMASLLTDVSFFCLPSNEEPWGVVIHEMAVAGLPLVISDVCGASTVFLREGYNGFLFKNQQAADLKSTLVRMMQATDEERIRMSHNSHELGNHINPAMWSYNLLSTLK